MELEWPQSLWEQVDKAFCVVFHASGADGF